MGTLHARAGPVAHAHAAMQAQEEPSASKDPKESAPVARDSHDATDALIGFLHCLMIAAIATVVIGGWAYVVLVSVGGFPAPTNAHENARDTGGASPVEPTRDHCDIYFCSKECLGDGTCWKAFVDTKSLRPGQTDLAWDAFKTLHDSRELNPYLDLAVVRLKGSEKRKDADDATVMPKREQTIDEARAIIEGKRPPPSPPPPPHYVVKSARDHALYEQGRYQGNKDMAFIHYMSASAVIFLLHIYLSARKGTNEDWRRDVEKAAAAIVAREKKSKERSNEKHQ